MTKTSIKGDTNPKTLFLDKIYVYTTTFFLGRRGSGKVREGLTPGAERILIILLHLSFVHPLFYT